MVLEDFPKLAKKFSRFVVGLSGGQDSVAILHFLKKAEKEQKGESSFMVEAVHVNHGLQKQAKDFEKFCETLCSSLKVKLRIRRVSVGSLAQKNEGVESAARKVRYKALMKDLALSDCLVLGHNSDDQLETFLLQWIRGCGINGLVCMERLKQVSECNCFVWRPLLHMRKEEINSYLDTNKVSWIEDSTNASYRFDRNKIRGKVIPEILSIRKGAAKGMLRSIENLQTSKQIIDSAIAERFQVLSCKKTDLNTASDFSRIIISRLKLVKEDDRHVSEILRYWLNRSGLVVPPKNRLNEFIRQIRNSRSEAISEISIIGDSCNYKLTCRRGQIYLIEKK